MTPTRYLELLCAFRSLLDKRTEVKRTPRGQPHTAWSSRQAHRGLDSHETDSHDNTATAALAFAASLNESELMLCGLARWKSTYDLEVYDHIVAPN